MHPPGAYSGKCVHPEFKSSAHKLRYTRHIGKMVHTPGAYAGCIAFKIVHPALKSCMEAPLISNTAIYKD